MFASRAFLLATAVALISTQSLVADASPDDSQPFAGRVVGSKVRMRLQPDLGAPVVGLLDEDAFLIVCGEEEDFYAVAPPAGTQAYIYRPYVLDGIVEGAHVNVRLKPDVDAPILVQLNTGDRVEGVVCADNPRWMEIALPDTAHFFVAKDYLENAGGIELVTQRAERREAVAGRLQDAYLASQEALNRSTDALDLEALRTCFAAIEADYPDFPEYVARANAVLDMVEQLAEQKQLATAQGLDEALAFGELSFEELDQLAFGANELVEIALEPGRDTEVENPMALARPAVERNFATDKMLAWSPVESGLFEVWAMDKVNASLDAYYREQTLDGVTLTGIVETYDRPVRNRPGDYVLIQEGRPVAFLYSTHVNLEECVGQGVTVRGLPRPNHNFAFPAYFVLTLEG